MSDGSINADQVFLVELDMLLDSRIGVMANRFPEQFQEIDMVGYLGRDVDKPHQYLPGVSEKEWKLAYAQRNVDDLKKSLPTEFLISMVTMLDTLVKQAVTLPVSSKVVVDVNLYPYTLTPEEADDIRDCVQHYAGKSVVVNTVHYQTSQITPALLKRVYSVYACYGFSDWHMVNADKLMKSPMPDVTIMAPRFFLEKRPSETDMQIGKDKIQITAEDSVRMLMAEFVQIALIPPRQASILDLTNEQKPA